MADPALLLLTEKLEILDGSRKNRRRAAVRIEDVAALLELGPSLKSAHAAGSAPTKAEHDALVDDVRMLHQRLQAVQLALQRRILP